MTQESTPFRGMVAGLSAMGPVTIREQVYKGEYLAMLVAFDPEHPELEAARTPQVIFELGRLVAAASHDKEFADVEYRMWRDRVAFEVGNDLEAATNAGFDSATNPGEDAKGKPKPGKCPTNADIEIYIRTLPEYQEHYAKKLAAEEAWATLFAAFEAAKARQSAIKAFAETGAMAPRAPTNYGSDSNGGDNGYNIRHGGEHDAPPPVTEMETRMAAAPRTPIPPPPAMPVGPPPPPPSTRTT